MLDFFFFLLFHFALSVAVLVAWNRLSPPPASLARSLGRGGACFALGLLTTFAVLRPLANAKTFQLFGQVVARVETRDSVVALTFDDGPTPMGTGILLPMLEEQGVRATFFLSGKAVEEFQPETREIVAAGHEVGNHAFTHRSMYGKPLWLLRNEVELTDRQIRRAGYTGDILFRAPYGKKLVALPWYLSRTHRTHVTWDVDPDNDPEIARKADRITAEVLARTRPGSIVLLHAMSPSRTETLKAVPGIIRGLRERGYRFVTVSELMKGAAQPRLGAR